jgi:quercetin dioxygenase-like cupin family protein
MWTQAFDGPEARRVAFGEGATIEVPPNGESAGLAAIRVTIAAGAQLGEHDHGSSDALLIPLAGRLTLRGGDGEAQLAPGLVVFVAAGERVSVENTGETPASMAVCFAPPTFVTGLIAASERATAYDSVGPAAAAFR